MVILAVLDWMLALLFPGTPWLLLLLFYLIVYDQLRRRHLPISLVFVAGFYLLQSVSNGAILVVLVVADLSSARLTKLAERKFGIFLQSLASVNLVVIISMWVKGISFDFFGYVMFFIVHAVAAFIFTQIFWAYGRRQTKRNLWI